VGVGVGIFVVGVDSGVERGLCHAGGDLGLEGGFLLSGFEGFPREGFGEFSGCCALGCCGGGGFGGLREGFDATAIPALRSGLVEFNVLEELVAEGVAEETSVFEDLVAGVFPAIVFRLFFVTGGADEGFGGDEAEFFVDDGFLEDGFGGNYVDGTGVTVGGAAGCVARGGGDGDGL
jgi:hypothetical protein